MKKLHINIDELAYVLHRGQTLDMASFLNIKNGEIINIPTERSVLQNLIDLEDEKERYTTTDMVQKLLPEDHENLVEIPNIFQQNLFNLMTGFISSISDEFPVHYAKLEQAIIKEGGYTAFRKIISDNKKLFSRYIKFRDTFFEDSAIEWLQQYQIEVI
jgi:hypothetical protein